MSISKWIHYIIDLLYCAKYFSLLTYMIWTLSPSDNLYSLSYSCLFRSGKNFGKNSVKNSWTRIVIRIIIKIQYLPATHSTHPKSFVRIRPRLSL